MGPPEDDGGRRFATSYANARQLIAWVLGLGENVRLLEPPELVDEAAERLAVIVERHEGEPDFVADPKRRRTRASESANGKPDRANGSGDTPIRPERFARLVALAGILIQSARGGVRPRTAEVCERLQITEQELREDVDVLNVVNFGGGSYVLYAEVQGDEIDVDPEPYSDNFARPARLLPVEAKALVAAIDLIGEHLPEGALDTAREKIVAALG
jgi:proteasome accessory factor C